MSESMSSLFRRGMISEKQMGRMAKPAILRQTKSGVPTKMAAFDQKDVTDGGIKSKDKGAKSVRKAIDNDQSMGSPSDGGGKPSRGGQTVTRGALPKVDQIDQGDMQKPEWPRGGGDRVKKNLKPVGRHGLGGTSKGLRSSGPQYGGPSNRTYG
jgi:hypothetical protein